MTVNLRTDSAGNTLLAADHVRLTDADFALLRRYARLERSANGWTVKSKGRYAGLLRVGESLIYLPPVVSVETFLGMILVNYGLDSALGDEALVGAGKQRITTFRDLQELLASLLVSQSEAIAGGHVAQGYLQEEGRTTVVRGRPLWHESRRYPSDGRIHCRFQLKSTNVHLNRVVLSGLIAAAACISDERWAGRARTQRFLWSSVADPLILRPLDISTAKRSLSRLTVHYERALDLISLLLFGGRLEVSDARPGPVPMPLFDMASLFELLTTRLVNLAVAERGWRCASQTTESQVLLDGDGRIYRRIRPDQLLLDARDRLVGVIDTKFKPRYAANGPGLSGTNKVSREDIYQLFFYSERLRRLHNMRKPLPAFLVVPVLAGATPPGEPGREIVWSDDHEEERSRLTVVPIDVARAVRAVAEGESRTARLLLDGLFDRLKPPAVARTWR